MVRLLAEHKGREVLTKYKSALLKEYRFWVPTDEEFSTHKQGNILRRYVYLGNDLALNRYWDAFETPRPESYREDVELALTSMQPSPQLYRNIRAAAESGWDFSSRWFGDRTGFAGICTTDILPVDLNCLLWHLEDTLLGAYKIDGERRAIREFEQLCDWRKESINHYCWDEMDGFYLDFNFKKGMRTSYRTLAAMYPLYFKLATQAQSDMVAEIIENDFLKPGGLTTTLLETGQQWDAPNGWAPLQWMAYIGLKNYGHDRLANEVRSRWLNTVESVYQKTGKMTEKYNVFNDAAHAGGGEYENQDGFGWTNGVYLGMKV
jgi:alpha,alpha-trehalase